MLSLEAQQLTRQADKFDPYRLILAVFKDRPIIELRELGKLLQKEAGVIAVLVGYDGQKLSVVVNCADNVAVTARDVLLKHLAQIGGKGGGDDKIAQGGGRATEQQLETFFAKTHTYIVESK
jgi:alanyl-tRNA synthetase